MGKSSRPKPARLSEKLLRIRTSLGLSQNEIIARMGLNDSLMREEVSLFERGLREPPLQVLLEYSRAANVYLEVLADDELDLPDKLPSAKKSEGKKRVPAPRGKRR
jgi:transcriptional regulator with XRE-family HTH domain